MKTVRKQKLLMLLALLLVGVGSRAQEVKPEADTTSSSDTSKPKESKMEKTLKKTSEIEGLFTMYRDSTSGTLYMKVREDQLDKEFIFFSQLENGVIDAGLFKGAYKRSEIFKIEKEYDRLRFVEQNTSYYFDPDNPLSKASNANVSNAVVASLKIIADDKSGMLIKADDLFKKETLAEVKPNYAKNYKGFKLGSLNTEKTRIVSINNYEDNLNILTEYVYANGSPDKNPSAAVTDRRSTAIQVFQMIMEMPENDYQPRFDDPRVGYFLDLVEDQTTTETVNYRDMINRWHLVKKDPKAKLSEPIEPIIWWIENTTPHKFRESIKTGVLEWNKAFEQIGFKNAIVVKVQPDNATWNAGDVRYNVLRWTSSPRPPFGGYGPSFSNPRTGQILGADIMLEYVYHTNRVFLEGIIGESSKEVLSLTNDFAHCSAGHHLHSGVQFGRALLMGSTAKEEELNRMQQEAMIELVMHEVGHTLGLNHNMKSSYAVSIDDLRDAKWTAKNCLTGSVMDYNDINIHPERSKQGNYYSTTIGPYDYWAIEYGYSPTTDNEELKQILEKSTRPELIFGNDADDMRRPGKGIDPRVMIDDLSDDPVSFAVDKLRFVTNKMKTLDEDFYEKGEFYEDYRRAFFTLQGHYWGDLAIISRQIGGIYVERTAMGQSGEKLPYTAVPEEDQREAMAILAKHAFGAEAFDVSGDIIRRLAKQRRGFNFFGGNEDPKIHSYILDRQKRILSQLLHKNVLRRLVDSELYGNTYTIEEHFEELNKAIFGSDDQEKDNKFRQNLQLHYTDQLIKLFEDKSWTGVERTAVFMALKNIENTTDDIDPKDLSSANRALINIKIKEALEVDKG